MTEYPMLASLWMPILLSGVIVFLASSVLHMFTSWHKDDYPRLPNEDGVRNALRPFAIPPGDYVIPRAADQKEMRDPAFKEKMIQGPNVMMTVMPSGLPAMGKPLAQWFCFSLFVSLFAAYVTSHALAVGASYLEVFRFVGATAFASYALALWPLRIWYRRALGTTIRATIDGLLFACLSAGVFGWLWPR